MCLNSAEVSQTVVKLTLSKSIQRDSSNQTTLPLELTTRAEREALQFLVVPTLLDAEVHGITPVCTTICTLHTPAWLVTAGWEAKGTMYRDARDIDFVRTHRWRSLIASDRGTWEDVVGWSPEREVAPNAHASAHAQVQAASKRVE
jgi:hypothetical protein